MEEANIFCPCIVICGRGTVHKRCLRSLWPNILLGNRRQLKPRLLPSLPWPSYEFYQELLVYLDQPKSLAVWAQGNEKTEPWKKPTTTELEKRTLTSIRLSILIYNRITLYLKHSQHTPLQALPENLPGKKIIYTTSVSPPHCWKRSMMGICSSNLSCFAKQPSSVIENPSQVTRLWQLLARAYFTPTRSLSHALASAAAQDRQEFEASFCTWVASTCLPIIILEFGSVSGQESWVSLEFGKACC